MSIAPISKLLNQGYITKSMGQNRAKSHYSLYNKFLKSNNAQDKLLFITLASMKLARNSSISLKNNMLFKKAEKETDTKRKTALYEHIYEELSRHNRNIGQKQVEDVYNPSVCSIDESVCYCGPYSRRSPIILSEAEEPEVEKQIGDMMRGFEEGLEELDRHLPKTGQALLRPSVVGAIGPGRYRRTFQAVDTSGLLSKLEESIGEIANQTFNKMQEVAKCRMDLHGQYIESAYRLDSSESITSKAKRLEKSFNGFKRLFTTLENLEKSKQEKKRQEDAKASAAFFDSMHS